MHLASKLFASTEFRTLGWRAWRWLMARTPARRCAAVGATAGLLLATRVREKGVLPGGHTVHLVTDSQWVLIPLQASHL